MPSKYLLAALLLLLPAAAHAQTARKTAPAAPTQPVTSSNLPAPVFQSDTRNLEAILGKEEAPQVIREEAAAAPAAPAKATPPAPLKTVPAQPAKQVIADEPAPEEGFFSSIFMSVRVGAIRWRDAIEILFTGIIAWYVRSLYRLSREQQKILSHAIRSSEYAAAAAKRSAEIAETLMLEYQKQKQDEAQGKLDLR